MLPALSSTHCCIFDDDVHTNIIASIATKDTHKENKKGPNQRGEIMGRRKGKRENRKNPLTGGGMTVPQYRL